MQRLAPVDYLNKYLLMVHKGDTLDREQFRRNLEQAGYLHVNQVMSHSEFSIRGSIIDLFPMGSDRPFRIDYSMMKLILSAILKQKISALRMP